MPRQLAVFAAALIAVALVATACGGSDDALTVYSGRSEELVGPLIAQFEEDTGIAVDVRYGDSAELAATILEEGDNSPADVFFAQDPASLGAVAQAGLFAPLGADFTAKDQVPARFRDRSDRWVGISGRARVVVYDTTKVDPSTLPSSEDGFIDQSWAGRVAIAPTNGSFLAFVAAKILLDGEDATSAWLEAVAANDVQTFANNSSIVEAVDGGTVDAGLVNHYYLFRLIAEQGDSVAADFFMPGGGAGSLVMPAGAGILGSSTSVDAATRFLEFMLSAEAQRYFADETFEYPLVAGVDPDPRLPDIESLATPDIDLSDLATALDTATDLVAEAGLL